MSDADRNRWDELYREGAYQERTQPCVFLEEQADLLPRGRTLELACGAGRNSIFLASLGCQVEGWDISTEGLARAGARAEELGLDITWRACDLEHIGLARSRYDLIVQVRYVNRALIPRIVDALRPGGVYLCEQHLTTERQVIGPSNPAFRLDPGELPELVPPLNVECYREVHRADPDGRSVALVQMLARRSE